MQFLAPNPWNLPPIGTRVSFSGTPHDHAGEGYVVAHLPADSFRRGGARIILDDERDRGPIAIADFTSAHAKYRLLDAPAAEPEEILRRLRDQEAKHQALKAAQAAAKAEHTRLEAAGRVIADRLIGPTAKALIVAEYVHDESDSQTDYFNHRTTRRVVLAESAHTRDLFTEMKRAAVRFVDTRPMALTGIEHREKYSMGAGYYLSERDYGHATGWQIRKVHRSSYGWSEEIYQSLAIQHALPDRA